MRTPSARGDATFTATPKRNRVEPRVLLFFRGHTHKPKHESELTGLRIERKLGNVQKGARAAASRPRSRDTYVNAYTYQLGTTCAMAHAGRALRCGSWYCW